MTDLPGGDDKPRVHSRLVSQALVGGLLLVALAAAIAAGATGPGLVLLAGVVPVIFFSYLGDVDRWSDQGVLPLLSAFLAGGAVGGAWAAGVLVWDPPDRASAVAVVVFPVAASLAGTAVVHRFSHYDEVLDGYAFTAAIAVGWYACFLVGVMTPPVLQGSFDPASTGDLLQLLVPSAVLMPVTVAASTGVVAATVWVAREPGPSEIPRRWAWSAAVILIAVAVLGAATPGGEVELLGLTVAALAAVLVARAAMVPLLKAAGEAPVTLEET